MDAGRGPHPHEAYHLKLDSSRAREQLGSRLVMELEEGAAVDREAGAGHRHSARFTTQWREDPETWPLVGRTDVRHWGEDDRPLTPSRVDTQRERILDGMLEVAIRDTCLAAALCRGARRPVKAQRAQLSPHLSSMVVAKHGIGCR